MDDIPIILCGAKRNCTRCTQKLTNNLMACYSAIIANCNWPFPLVVLIVLSYRLSLVETCHMSETSSANLLSVGPHRGMNTSCNSVFCLQLMFDPFVICIMNTFSFKPCQVFHFKI